MNSRNQAVVVIAIWAAVLCGYAVGAPTEKYTATSLIHLSPRTPTLLERDRQEYCEKEFQSFKTTQQLKLKSRFVLTRALRNKPELMKLPTIDAHVRAGDLLHWVEGVLKVEFPEDTELMSVSCTLNDPKTAASLVNAVVDAYKTEVADVEAEMKRARFAELDRAVIDMDQELRRKKQERRNLMQETRNLSPPASSETGKGASSKPPSVDLEMLDLEIAILEQEYRELRLEAERARIELRAPPRISIFERAGEPVEPD